MKKILVILFLLFSTSTYSFVPVPHSSSHLTRKVAEENKKVEEERYAKLKAYGFSLVESRVQSTGYSEAIKFLLTIVFLFCLCEVILFCNNKK